MIYKLGELFCGPGGLAWGALHADIGNGDRIIHAWANDCDGPTCETYRRNICPDAPDTVYQADIRSFDLAQLSPIDALAFGFPCNDYSTAGEQKGLFGAYGPLYSYGIKALRIFRPKWFLAENVSGLLSANAHTAFPLILAEMEDAGYRVAAHLYRFEEYGIPQTRHRIVIVGIRKDIPATFRVPSPAPYAGADVSCRTALEVPQIPADAPNNELPAMSSAVVRRLSYIKPGENAFNAALPPSLALHVKRAKLSHIYRRLDPDRPAYTVTASGGAGRIFITGRSCGRSRTGNGRGYRPFPTISCLSEIGARCGGRSVWPSPAARRRSSSRQF